jgi:hypothetical protein
MFDTRDYNENIHLLNVTPVTAARRRRCIDVLGVPNDSGMLFTVAFEVLVTNLHADDMNIIRLRAGGRPWVVALNRPGPLTGPWLFPTDPRYRQEMISNYNFWAKELFFNANFRLEMLENMGLSTFLKDPYLTKKELSIDSKSYVQVLTEEKYKKLKDLGHPSLWEDYHYRAIYSGGAFQRVSFSFVAFIFS